ncbi:MAG TPA: chlorite dismutase family protein [Methylomirabilota bacterium]
MEQTPPGHCMLYTFFKAAPSWLLLGKDDKSRAVAEYVSRVDDFARRLTVRAYSTIGLRRDTDFLLWLIAPEMPVLQEMLEGLRHTVLAAHLDNTYTYLAVTRESQYVKAHTDDETTVTMQPGQSRYLFVYPFVKTREWYLLPMEERRRMMAEHIRTGHRFPAIRINTAYSFGLDDQDFVVAFEGDDPKEFVTLLMKLRETEASRYTVRDTPQHTCARRPLEEILEALG